MYSLVAILTGRGVLMEKCHLVITSYQSSMRYNRQTLLLMQYVYCCSTILFLLVVCVLNKHIAPNSLITFYSLNVGKNA